MNVLFCLSCVKFRGLFFYTCNISKAVRSRKINGDQWRSATGSMIRSLQIPADHCGSWQSDRSGRSGACRKLDQTWQDVWLHNRDILSASCMCIDNTAVTFQYIGFGVYQGLKTRHSRTKKGRSFECPFFFFQWFDIFFICFCVICGNINTDSKRKKSYQRCVLEFGRSSHLLISRKDMISHIMNL